MSDLGGLLFENEGSPLVRGARRADFTFQPKAVSVLSDALVTVNSFLSKHERSGNP